MAAWELDIDHDGDGSTSRIEYYAGSDPRDPGSVPAPAGANLTLSGGELAWTSVRGRRVGVEDSDDLVVWHDTGPRITGDGGAVGVPVEEPATRRFYRLAYLEPGDRDGDGLSSIEESILGTSDGLPDTDGDSFDDGTEVLVTLTDPLVPNLPGGTIRGTVLTDPDNDGDLSDGSPVGGATVYLDANYNGRLDPGERTETAGEKGDYEFFLVPPGVHHVRQELPVANVQTFPAAGLTPSLNLLPDEVVSYVHPAPGVAQFDVAYGRMASDWPGDWGAIANPNRAEIIDTVDVVLKPIGVRNRASGLQPTNGVELLTLPIGAEIVLRFDEVIVDGPGPDLLIHSYPQGAADEEVEILVGASASDLTSLGIFNENLGIIALDFTEFGVPGPVQFVKCIGQDLRGSWEGFELTGMEVINHAPPAPDAHIVIVTGDEIFDDRDFGRHFRDLPPTLVLSGSDGVPGTAGIRAGETLEVTLHAFDDLGLDSVTLTANGEPVALDANNRATLPVTAPGSVLLEATATDSAGQTAEESSQYYILTASGEFPFDPNLTGQSVASGVGAPRVRILTPGPGEVFATDVDIVADIIGSPPPTSWTVEYAEVDLIDPYDLNAPDPDYVALASGSGNIHSSPVATMPLGTLPDGIYFVRVCARNSPTQIACYGQVIAKNVPEAELRPQISIDSPDPGTHVTMTVDIAGTITSTRPLVEWYVEYARAGQVDLNNLAAGDADWKRIGAGSATVPTPSVLASFDGTLMENNGYVVRIVAKNDIGLGWVEPLSLEVTGEAKLGRNRLEFRDLVVDLAGFPLQFVRVYDSMKAGEEGELGFGWSLGLSDPDIRETVPDTGTLGLFGSTPFRDGTRIYITAPTGERLGFTFKPEAGPASAFGTVYRASFEPDLGNYHTLEVPEGDLAFLELNDDGSVGLFFFGLPYNPEKYILRDPGGNRFTYHERRGFLGAEDRNGNTVTPNEGGIVHSAGLSLRFQRDTRGRITKVIDAEDNEWCYGYDTAGDLVSVTDPGGRTTTFTYFDTPAHYLDGIFDPLGRQPVRYEYDPVSGRLQAIVDEAGNRQEVTWDPAGFTGSVRDRRGNLTRYEYDARGNVTRRIDPLLNDTFFEYGDPGNPDLETAVVDARGMRYESQYNARGQLTRYRLPRVTGIAGANRMDFSYDADGNLASVRDFRNRAWDFSYDANGNITEYESPLGPKEINSYSPQGLLVSSTDGTNDGYRTDYSYDAYGQFTTVTDNLGFRFDLELDRSGNPRSATDGNGGTYSFDYDGSGLPVGQTDPGGMSRTLVEQPDGSYTRGDRLGNRDHFKLGSDGLLEEYTQADGGRIVPAYDENRNLETLTDPLGNVTTYTYDELDRLTGITDAAGNGLAVTLSPVGDVEVIVDRNGKRRTFAYDENRRITHERWHDDGAGGAVIREIVYTWSAGGGSLANVTDTAGAVVHEHRFSGKIPRPGNVRVTYHDQQFWNVEYVWTESGDRAPGVSTVRIRKGATVSASVFADYFGGRPTTYSWNRPGNANNRVQVRRNPDGSKSSMRRFTGAGGSGDPISETLFSYGPMGRLDGIRHEDGGGTGTLVDPAAAIAYGRDAEGRVETVTQGGNTATYAYDVLDQLTGVTNTDVARPDEDYAYDSAGNRTGSHRLATAAVVGTGNRISSIGDFSYTYDLEGNISVRTNTATGEVTEFAYDHRNRLVEAVVRPAAAAPASDTLRFDYDFVDRMISREINGAKTWIIYDRAMPAAEFADGAAELNASFFYSPDKVDDLHAVWRSDTGERWFLKDHLGSIRGITDEDGNLLSWVDYDAFGNLQPGSAPAGGETLRFAGRPYIEQIALYDNRRRFYDPVTGRFTQEDPSRIAGGRDLNLYRYVLNNPGNYTDPYGTAAALEQGLLDAYLTLADTLCDFAECVGSLWGGVVKGFVNVESADVTGQWLDCVIDLVPVPEWPPNLCEGVMGQVESIQDEGTDIAIDGVWKFLLGGGAGEAAAGATKKAKAIVDVVVKCGEAIDFRTETEEVGCPK